MSYLTKIKTFLRDNPIISMLLLTLLIILIVFISGLSRDTDKTDSKEPFVKVSTICSDFIVGKVYNINGVNCRLEAMDDNTYFISLRCDKDLNAD